MAWIFHKLEILRTHTPPSSEVAFVREQGNLTVQGDILQLRSVVSGEILGEFCSLIVMCAPS